MTKERRPFPWVSRAHHLTPLDRIAALFTLEDMDEEEELRFLWTHPELEAGRGYYRG